MWGIVPFEWMPDEQSINQNLPCFGDVLEANLAELFDISRLGIANVQMPRMP